MTLYFPENVKAAITKDSVFFISNTKVEIIIPHDSVKGSILVLPGWNFPQNDICLKTDFCNKFTAQGFVLIMPNMQKSIYSHKLFKETREDWRTYPTLLWITDSLIKEIQTKFKLLLENQNNFIFGISTGGRGVALVLENTNELFNAGAALSGDYNQLLDLKDNLMLGYYGEYSKFPERWSGEDNPFIHASKIKTPIFIAHGKEDKIVPFKQSELFFEELIKIQPNTGHKLDLIEKAGHSYEFWSSEFDKVLIFFNTHKK